MKNRWLLMTVLALAILSLTKPFQYGLFLLCIMYWWYRFRDRTVLLLLVLCGYFLLPYHPQPPPETMIFRVDHIGENYMILKRGLFHCQTTRLMDVSYDDVLEIEGQFASINEESYFYTLSYATRQKAKGIFYEVSIEHYQLLQPGKSVRRALWDKIAEAPEEIAPFLRRILFRYQEESVTFAEEIELFLNSSGIYLSSCTRLLERCLSFFLYPSFVTCCGVFFLLLIGYSSFFSCTVYRLLLNRLLFFVAESTDRAGITFLLLLVINPYYRYNLAFLLPFAWQFLRQFSTEQNRSTGILAVLPVQLMVNHHLNLFQVITFSLWRTVFFVLYLLSWVSLLLGQYTMIAWCSGFLSYLSSLWPTISISGQPGFLWLVGYSYVTTRYVQGKQKKYLLCLALLLLFNQYRLLFSPHDEAVFLNIGHGDAFVYHAPFTSEVLLLDTGSSYNYQKLRNYLWAKGVQVIDTLILTHPDNDHAGNLEALAMDFMVRQVITEKTEAVIYRDLVFYGLLTDTQYEDENENSQIYLVKIGGLTYLFCADISERVETDLFTAYSGLQADILKVAHHGSNTASSERFLGKLFPRLAIISCGKYSLYHHPSYEVTERLTNLRIPYLVTNWHGDIRIVSGYFHHFLSTAQGQFILLPHDSVINETENIQEN